MENISPNHKSTMFRARSAVLSRDYDLAIQLFLRVLNEQPDNIDLMHELASTYVRSGQDKRAFLICQQILEKDRTDFGALVSLGGIYRRLERYDESVSVLERALAISEDSVQSYYNLGFTYKQMGLYDDAIDCFNKVIEKDPTDILAYNHLGSIFSLRNDSKNSIAAYRKGLQLDANHPILHYNLAHEYEKQGQNDDVQAEYEAALRVKPGWSEAINGYAHFLMSQNRYKEAYEILSQGIEVTPENMHLQQSMGLVQLRRGEYQDAGQRFKTVLEYDSDSPRALMGLADVYVFEGKEVEASNLLEKMETYTEKPKAVQMQYARSLLNVNKFEEAGGVIKELSEKYHFDLGIIHLVAEYYACCNEVEQLEQSVEKIREINNTYYLHYLDIALRFKQIGLYEQSQTYLVEYLNKLPNDPVALAALASCYEKCHQYGDAMRFYQQALTKDSKNRMLQDALERMTRYSAVNKEKDEKEKKEEIIVPPLIGSNLRDLYKKDEKWDVESSKNNLIDEECDVRIDEEHYLEPETDEIILKLDSSSKSSKVNLEHYDPLTITNNENKKSMAETTASFQTLTYDGGPVDYDPLHNFDNHLEFYDEEDAIFDNINQKPEEYFLKNPFELETESDPYRPLESKNLPSDDSSLDEISLEEVSEEGSPELVPPSTSRKKKPSVDDIALPWDFDGDVADLEPEPELEELEVQEEDSSFDEIEELKSLDEAEAIEEDFNLDKPKDFPEPKKTPSQSKVPVQKEKSPVKNQFLKDNLGVQDSPEIFLEIDRLLANKELNEEHKDIVRLFQQMKDLCTHLPLVKREGFNASMKRMQMDFIISRLSGNPGLLSLSNSLRENGLVPVPEDKYDIVERFDEVGVSSRVLSMMRPLVQQLPDKDNAMSLDSSLRSLLERMSEL